MRTIEKQQLIEHLRDEIVKANSKNIVKDDYETKSFWKGYASALESTIFDLENELVELKNLQIK